MLQGVITCSQYCHYVCAPTSFIWCQPSIAEMPLYERTKGKVMEGSQKCRQSSASPTNFSRSHHDIAEMLQVKRSTGEVSLSSQKCQHENTSPNNHRGSCDTRRNAREVSPPPNLGHHTPAEMPRM